MSEDQKLKSSVEEQIYYTDDIFHNPDSPIADYEDFTSPMPKWLDESRLACFLSGVFGLLFTVLNVKFFSEQFGHPFFLNLALLIFLTGFANYLIYPNILKYCLVNGLEKADLLKGLNTFMLVFSILLLVFLFSFPVTGLGLALILVPAPLVFSYFSRTYTSQPKRSVAISFSFDSIFDTDLRRIAWLSLIFIFLALIFAFTGILLRVI